MFFIMFKILKLPVNSRNATGVCPRSLEASGMEGQGVLFSPQCIAEAGNWKESSVFDLQPCSAGHACEATWHGQWTLSSGCGWWMNRKRTLSSMPLSQKLSFSSLLVGNCTRLNQGEGGAWTHCPHPFIFVWKNSLLDTLVKTQIDTRASVCVCVFHWQVS